MSKYDYIIIGAGSAGCVLAARLTENPNNKVLLLEAGGKDKNMMIHMPAGVGSLIGGEKENWYYYTEEQKHLNNRKLFWPRGKVLGGSSSINGMIYIRGHGRDYDMWRQMGLEGWGFADVLPYFRRSEGNENGNSAFHGGEGPLGVSNSGKTNVLFDAFVEAGKQAGYPYTDDFNGPQQEGVGPYQHTIKNGQRCSAAKGYLVPALDRPNLTVETEALTNRILFEGKRAIGVEYTQKGQVKTAHAEAEVLLSGGAVNSPQVLMLSGVGKSDYLSQFGIETVADLPGVGQNMQDHLDCTVIYECSQPITLHSMSNPLRMLMAGMQYTFFKSGVATSNGLESGAFLKTRPELEIPDVQIHFVAAMMRDHARQKSDRHGFTVHVCQLRPESRGYVGLKSADPADHALIQPNYLESENDLRVMRDGTRMVRNIIEQRAMDAYRGPEFWPGADKQSDAEIDGWIRDTAETIYHPVGTAKMGHDEMAVVDERCRVHGLEGLRVIDASVMPTLVGGNTNAPTIMIAEKISDDILGKKPLPPENVTIAEDRVGSAA
ncbi:choline dehydrogenase [Parvibaculum indicum]|uniref:choline dehydrogenase n=1 Tax=Parvibaculum indicum TaxID=562969 RepID=UPI00141D9BB2|nr:choline dehydrogenase [Parvibaculum indicum]NIJ40205.1 choline dehydrogenase [Parvibaculum indicum]